ncbi:MAG TPA: VCBS repeat-containing protein [Fibrella sp.]
MRLLFCLLPVSLLAQPTPNFRVEVVDNQINIGYGMAIGDVDGDRRPDILMADQHDIVWYKNPGGPRSAGRQSGGQPTDKQSSRWVRYVLASNLTPQDNVCIAARDLDGDGRVEVAVGAGWNPAETGDSTKSGAVFYLIRPSDPTKLWEAVRLPHEVTTHRMRWAKTGQNAYQLIVTPLHGLGNKNGSGRGVRVWGYEFPKDPRSRWKQHLVDSTMHLTHNFEVWEDASNTSLVIGGKEGSKIVRWAAGRWVPADAGSGQQAASGMQDIGEIRRGTPRLLAAVQPMHGNRLVVYGQNASRNGDTLSTTLNQGHALVCADWLGMGRDQIAVGWRNPNAEGKVGVRLFRPEATGKWTEFAIDDSVRMACEDMLTADLDNDGDLDLIASGRATLNVLIYWNQRIP